MPTTCQPFDLSLKRWFVEFVLKLSAADKSKCHLFWSHVIAIGPLGSRLNEIEPNLRISLGSTIHTSLQRIDIAATALEHGFHGSGLTSWSPGLEGGNHSFSGWRDGDMTGQRDLPRRKFVSINLPVGAVVRANR
jgi:hypothetical protein